MHKQITNYIRAGYPGIYIVSHEEPRVESELKAVADSLKYNLFAWSITDGLVNASDGSVQDAGDPVDALNAVSELPENSVVMLRDFHLFVEDGNPVLIRTVKNCLVDGKTKGKCLIIVGCRQTMPPELEREFVVLDFALPDKQQLGTVLDSICKSAKLTIPRKDAREAVLDAASGLTTTEAENAFALSVVERKAICPAVVAREKGLTVKKNGLLEIVDVKESLENVGGLGVLKDWLLKRRDAFSRRACEYGLPNPRGLMILGIPGTGKSLTAKVTASVFGRPLLKLDAGKLYGGLVGQSEGNLRSVIQTAEAIAPCVLWIDEIEKGFSGSRSSGQTDGGTSSRVFGSFISWMQEKTAPVFVVATANDVQQLPPEMLRKGRWDEMFFVDLPNVEERMAIWAIQITKYGRKPGEFDLGALAEMSDGLTGAEIEQAFIDSLYVAFDKGEEPGMHTISKVLSDTVPLSKLMGDQINALRKWAKGRARTATAVGPDRTGRKIHQLGPPAVGLN